MGIQEQAVGLVLIYQVLNSDGSARDISTYTVHDLIFQRPNNSNITVHAAFQNDGTDGKLIHTTVDGDLSHAGTFQVQARLSKVGIDEYSEVALFDVAKNL